jgi:DNA repair protein RadC
MQSSADKHLGPEGHRERLRQRFAKSGRSAMADYELLELLLTYVLPRIDTKLLAKALLHQFVTLLAVLQQPYERLIRVDVPEIAVEAPARGHHQRLLSSRLLRP